MTPRRISRTVNCTKVDAAARLLQAQKFYEVAELVETEANTLESSATVAASLAVLPGIAASDAAFFVALGQRSRGQDHKDAVELIRQIAPGGGDVASILDRLLDMKDGAQYGVIHVSGTDLKTAMRSAKALVDFATKVVRR
jgi:hypothetical protein